MQPQVFKGLRIPLAQYYLILQLSLIFAYQKLDGMDTGEGRKK
jgi:hypothetical protein